MRTKTNKVLALFILLITLNIYATNFKIKFSDNISKSPVSGDLYILLQRDIKKDPIYYFLNSEPIFKANVTNWSPDVYKTFTVNDLKGSYSKLSILKPGKYSIRIVMDINNVDRSFVFSKGNGYSRKIVSDIDPAKNNIINITVNNVVDKKVFKEQPHIKEVRIKSELQSKFHKRDYFLKAAVILPVSYFKVKKYYPTVYIIPGWGTTHHGVLQGDFQQKRYGIGMGEEKIYVFLNMETRLGFHCFADSENTGPSGSALIKEMIPYLENKFCIIKDHSMRFLMGQSSGGWAALWLQINYPDKFGGVWAASPDYVDFRAFDFDSIDIYNSENNILYKKNGQVRASLKGYKREWLIGTGEQNGSFEAVFSPRGKDGKPKHLFDRKTGKINMDTALNWEKYDISHILRNEKDLKKINNKIHIYAAADDPWNLDEPVKFLKKELEKTSLKYEIVIFKNGGHNIWTDQFRKKVHNQMDKIIKKYTEKKTDNMI